MNPLPLIFIALLTAGLGATAHTAIEKQAYDNYMHTKGW